MNNCISNDPVISIITQAIEEMKSACGKDIPLDQINISELSRRTGVSRQRLRTLRKYGFKQPRANASSTIPHRTVMDGFESISDNLLRQGITNSVVHFERLQEFGFPGSISSVKRYIANNKHLVPPERLTVVPQGNRGRRYNTGPGEAYQMDWGFTKAIDTEGNEFQVACFAMICHHCGMRYIEFFSSAKQENLFIGMIHAFVYMGIPKCVLTDNMKSVVIKRDLSGFPVWQVDYETFMNTIGFNTKLCKPRHPYTKGKVERLVRFVKTNFLAGRTFYSINDLNSAALEWCSKQNSIYHKEIDDIPYKLHNYSCASVVKALYETPELLNYLCPVRKISFDGFINFEGRRFGVPYRYYGKMARVCRKGDKLYIYSMDLKELLVTHDVTWSRRDSLCNDQYELSQPEELPTMPVKTRITMKSQVNKEAFNKFNFDEEDYDNG